MQVVGYGEKVRGGEKQMQQRKKKKDTRADRRKEGRKEDIEGIGGRKGEAGETVSLPRGR